MNEAKLLTSFKATLPAWKQLTLLLLVVCSFSGGFSLASHKPLYRQTWLKTTPCLNWTKTTRVANVTNFLMCASLRKKTNPRSQINAWKIHKTHAVRKILPYLATLHSTHAKKPMSWFLKTTTMDYSKVTQTTN